jgi:bifunctional non-homologous end joining protein LigD
LGYSRVCRAPLLSHRAAPLYTRNGYDFTERYPKIVAGLERFPVRSCSIDGEAMVVGDRGLSIFDALHWRLSDHAAVLCSFDLIELNGDDLRNMPLERRKATLAELLRGVDDGIAYNQHFAGDGAGIFQHACALGCEGIVSKWLGSYYRSGRVNHWLNVKNPEARGTPRGRRRLGPQAMECQFIRDSRGYGTVDRLAQRTGEAGQVVHLKKLD